MPMATMADAHREWHRNTGTPMGTPGCPQDACHLPEDYGDGATHNVITPDGMANVPAYSLAEAARIAREVAAATGKACKVEKIASAPEPDLWQTPENPALTALAAKVSGVEVERGTMDSVVATKERQQARQDAEQPEPLYDGIYTIEGAEAHRTFRLRTQGPEESFKPGEQVIGYLSGPNNERDYTGFGTVVNGQVRVWSKHRGNAALVTAAREFLIDLPGKIERGEVLLAAHCFRCHHTLTVPTSIYRGLGPDCAKKAGS